jgi:hypothetical protein
MPVEIFESIEISDSSVKGEGYFIGLAGRKRLTPLHDLDGFLATRRGMLARKRAPIRQSGIAGRQFHRRPALHD